MEWGGPPIRVWWALSGGRQRPIPPTAAQSTLLVFLRLSADRAWSEPRSWGSRRRMGPCGGETRTRALPPVRTRCRRSVGWRSRKPVWPSVAHVYRLPARFARLPARLCVPVGSRPGMPAPGCLRPVFRAPLTPCPPLPVCLLAGSTHPPTNNPHQPSVPPLGDRATKGGGGQGPDQQPALRLLSVSRAFDRSALPEAGEARHRSRPQQQPDQPGGRSREPNPHMPIRHHRSNQLTYVHYPSKAGQRAAINDMTRL